LRGVVANEEGAVELDACIMYGYYAARRLGCVDSKSPSW
jgi:hypothetical protein